MESGVTPCWSHESAGPRMGYWLAGFGESSAVTLDRHSVLEVPVRLLPSTRFRGVLLAVLAVLPLAACATDSSSTRITPSVVRKSETVVPGPGSQSSPERPPRVPTTEQRPTQPRAAVPAVLVGTWDGGSNTSAAKITFFADGNVRLDYNNGQSIPATVVVSDSSMNLYLPGGRRQTISQWSIERMDPGYGYSFLTLMLDGYSYVRQIAGG